jgi:hypothetical protein
MPKSQTPSHYFPSLRPPLPRPLPRFWSCRCVVLGMAWGAAVVVRGGGAVKRLPNPVMRKVMCLPISAVISSSWDFLSRGSALLCRLLLWFFCSLWTSTAFMWLEQLELFWKCVKSYNSWSEWVVSCGNARFVLNFLCHLASRSVLLF